MGQSTGTYRWWPAPAFAPSQVDRKAETHARTLFFSLSTALSRHHHISTQLSLSPSCAVVSRHRPPQSPHLSCGGRRKVPPPVSEEGARPCFSTASSDEASASPPKAGASAGLLLPAEQVAVPHPARLPVTSRRRRHSHHRRCSRQRPLLLPPSGGRSAADLTQPGHHRPHPEIWRVAAPSSELDATVRSRCGLAGGSVVGGRRHRRPRAMRPCRRPRDARRRHGSSPSPYGRVTRVVVLVLEPEIPMCQFFPSC